MPRKTVQPGPAPTRSPRVTRARAASAGLVVSDSFTSPPKGTLKRRNSAGSHKAVNKRPRIASSPSTPDANVLSANGAMLGSSGDASARGSGSQTSGLLHRVASTLLSPFSSMRRISSIGSTPSRVQLPPPVSRPLTPANGFSIPPTASDRFKQDTTAVGPPALTHTNVATIVEPTPRRSNLDERTLKYHHVESPSPTQCVDIVMNGTYGLPEQGDSDSDSESEDPYDECAAGEDLRANSPGRTYAVPDDSDSEDNSSMFVDRHERAASPPFPFELKDFRQWSTSNVDEYLRVVHGWDPEALEEAALAMRNHRTPKIITSLRAKLAIVEAEARDVIDAEIKEYGHVMRASIDAEIAEYRDHIRERIRKQVYDQVFEEEHKHATEAVVACLVDAFTEPGARNKDLQSLLGLSDASPDEVESFILQQLKRRDHSNGAGDDTKFSEHLGSAHEQPSAVSSHIWTQAPPATPSPSRMQLSPSKPAVTWDEDNTADTPERTSPPKYSSTNAPLPPKSSLKGQKIQGEELKSGLTRTQQQSYDRKLSEANKYTPKQPSRLREVSRLSASSAGLSGPIAAHASNLGTLPTAPASGSLMFSNFPVQYTSLTSLFEFDSRQLNSDPQVQDATDRIDWTAFPPVYLGSPIFEDLGLDSEKLVGRQAAFAVLHASA